MILVFGKVRGGLVPFGFFLVESLYFSFLTSFSIFMSVRDFCEIYSH